MTLSGGRLVRLESDINLICSIRDILMPDGPLIESNLSQETAHSEVPVRDTDTAIEKNNRNHIHAENSNRNVSKVITSSSEETDNHIDNNVNDLRNIKESAKILTISLQKAEDELRREREMKRNLLVGTLEMKNQLNAFEHQISQLNGQILVMKEEKVSLMTELQTLNEIKTKSEKVLKNHIEFLEAENSKLKAECQTGNNEILNMKNKFQELSALSHQKTESLESINTEFRTLQLNLTGCEEERKKLKNLNERFKTKVGNWKSRTNKAELDLKSLREAYSTNLLQKDQKIISLETTLKSEQDLFSSQITSALNLIKRTKLFVNSLKYENKKLNDASSLQVQNIESLTQLQTNLKEQNVKLNDEIVILKERFWGLRQNQLEKMHELQLQTQTLEQLLKEKELECIEFNKRCNELTLGMENLSKSYQDEKKQLEENITDLGTKLSRITENFQVLQKVSEDQIKTISKQRNDLESVRELSRNHDLKLRESQETEKALCYKLKEAENMNRELEFEISRLESKVSCTEENIRHHNCEEFVESKWNSRVKELNDRTRNLENDLKSLERERDEALTAARKALRQTLDMKETCDNRILKIRNENSQQVRQTQDRLREEDLEKVKKIRELENELTQMREAGNQVQRAYSVKIQQLQTALSACIGGQYGSNIGLLGPFQGIGGFPIPTNSFSGSSFI